MAAMIGRCSRPWTRTGSRPGSRRSPSFSDAPTLDGTPAEVGPLAAQRHPLVADAIAHWGATLATRLLAAALDAPVVAGRLLRALDDAGGRRSGRGRSDASGTRRRRRRDGARSPRLFRRRGLRSRADAAQRRADRVEFPSRRAVHGRARRRARVADPVLAARLLAASFDPCVPFRIELAGDHRPPSHAEVALHA